MRRTDAFYREIGYRQDRTFFENACRITGHQAPFYSTGRTAAQIWLQQKVNCVMVMATNLFIYELLKEKLVCEEKSSDRFGTYLAFDIPGKIWASQCVRIYKPDIRTGIKPPTHTVHGTTYECPVSSVEEVVAYFQHNGGLGSGWIEDLRYYIKTGLLAPRRRKTVKWN